MLQPYLYSATGIVVCVVVVIILSVLSMQRCPGCCPSLLRSTTDMSRPQSTQPSVYRNTG
ncbi:hypothetical protein CRUP_018941, partial [Coryphaenoides rupestris]